MTDRYYASGLFALRMKGKLDAQMVTEDNKRGDPPMNKFILIFRYQVVWCIPVFLLVSTVAWGADEILVQRIGELNGEIEAQISRHVTIVPISAKINARKTPIIYQAGTAFLKEDGTVRGLSRQKKKRIKQAYEAGQSIVILDASVHDVEALHTLIGEGVIYDSTTDPVVAAYILRRVNRIPTARVLTHARLSPVEAESPEDEALALTQAVEIIVNDLNPPAVTVREEDTTCGGPEQSACWTDTPVQTHTLTINSSSGVYNTSLAVYALHECKSGNDQYVVTAGADWTATQAKFQSASWKQGQISVDKNDNLDVHWQNTSDHCSGGIDIIDNASGDQRICRYQSYPLRYDMTVLPPTTGTITQVQAAPSATQGTATTYSSGFRIGISGGVNISGSGPSAGIQAGVSWDNMTTVDVPALLIETGNKGNEGVSWKYVYCTSGDKSGNCVSHVQMTGFSGACEQFKMGKPQDGQKKDGKLSATGQSVQFQASRDTRVDDSFDIQVTFTADIATTETRLWNSGFRDSVGNHVGPTGYCNSFGCSCSNKTSKHPVTASYTFKIPFPSTQCTQ